jgi:hypothetical protein
MDLMFVGLGVCLIQVLLDRKWRISYTWNVYIHKINDPPQTSRRNSTSKQTPAYRNTFPTNPKIHQHPIAHRLPPSRLKPLTTKQLHSRSFPPARLPTSRRRNTLVRQARIPSCHRDASPTDKRREQAEQLR